MNGQLGNAEAVRVARSMMRGAGVGLEFAHPQRGRQGSVVQPAKTKIVNSKAPAYLPWGQRHKREQTGVYVVFRLSLKLGVLASFKSQAKF